MTLNPQTFALFPLLPSELRLLIWSYAQPHRIINIHTTSSNAVLHFRVSQPQPSLLSVNHEARLHLLARYQILLDSDQCRICYFDHTHDAIYHDSYSHPFDGLSFIRFLTNQALSVKITKLALSEESLCLAYFPRHLNDLRGLEEVFVVSDTEYECAVKELVPGYGNGGKGEVLERRHAWILESAQVFAEKNEGCKAPRVRVVNRKVWSRDGSKIVESL